MTVEDSPVATSSGVTFRVEHGVLIAKIRAKSLIHQLATNRIKTAILEHLTEARSAVLVDCSELTLQVSSVFLSMLVHVQKRAREADLQTGVCCLSKPLREAYDVTALKVVIPCFESRREAIWRLGQVNPWQRVRAEAAVATLPAQGSSDSGWQSAVARIDANGKWVLSTIIAMSLATCVVAGYLVGNWTSPPHRGYPLLYETEANNFPFASEIAGRIRFTNKGVTLDDTAALVVAWPHGYQLLHQLEETEFKGRMEHRGREFHDLVFATRAASDGAYRMWAHGFGAVTDLDVLVVSNNLWEGGRISAVDQLKLSKIFERPEGIVGNRRYQLTTIRLERGKPYEFNIAFGPGQDAAAH